MPSSAPLPQTSPHHMESQGALHHHGHQLPLGTFSITTTPQIPDGAGRCVGHPSPCAHLRGLPMWSHPKSLQLLRGFAAGGGTYNIAGLEVGGLQHPWHRLGVPSWHRGVSGGSGE